MFDELIVKTIIDERTAEFKREAEADHLARSIKLKNARSISLVASFGSWLVSIGTALQESSKPVRRAKPQPHNF